MELQNGNKIGGLGIVWIVSLTIALFAGLLLGAILNDNLWPSVEVPPGVYILILIDNPMERMLVTGLAVGGATGLAGWLVLREHIVNAKAWILANMVGWAIGLAASERLDALIHTWSITGAIGGAIIGIAQWALLRRNTQRSMWWIVVWAVSGATVLKWIPPNLSLFVLFEQPLSFVIMGLVVGTVTGVTLSLLMRPHLPANSAQIQVGIGQG